MLSVLHLLRYRFFLSASFLPYLLGVAIAYYTVGSLHLTSFFLGLVGLAFAFAGVEAFNEYFDPADRVLSYERRAPSPLVFWVGAGSFAAALPIGIYLAVARGPWVIAFAILGFLIALFYVGPPLRLAFRGLGELGIFFAYGPLIVLGSYYIQTVSIDRAATLASLLPGALALSLAILNEIPDYYQDLLVGKRNIVVKLGKKRGVILYTGVIASYYIILVLGAFRGILPWLSLLVLFTLPLTFKSVRVVSRYYEEPKNLLPAINLTAILYVAANALFVLSYVIS